MKISVVMTVYNRKELLRKTLQSFSRQSFPKSDFEIVIVDDESTDGTDLMLKEFPELQINHIIMSKRLSHYQVKANSPALGLNIGFRQAQGEIIFKTDPEMYQVGETLALAEQCYSLDKMIFGRAYWLSEYYTSLIGRLEDQELVGLGEEGYDENIVPLVTPSIPAPLYFISVMPRKAILDIHGIDEQFVSGIACDDDDFAERMQVWGCMWDWNFDIIGFHQYHGPWWHEKSGQGFDSDLYKHNRAILDERMNKIGRTIFDRPVQDFSNFDINKKDFCIVNTEHEWGSGIIS